MEPRTSQACCFLQDEQAIISADTESEASQWFVLNISSVVFCLEHRGAHHRSLFHHLETTPCSTQNEPKDCTLHWNQPSRFPASCAAHKGCNDKVCKNASTQRCLTLPFGKRASHHCQTIVKFQMCGSKFLIWYFLWICFVFMIFFYKINQVSCQLFETKQENPSLPLKNSYKSLHVAILAKAFTSCFNIEVTK